MSRLERLESRVRELEESLRRTLRAKEEAAARTIGYEIPGGLGAVRITGSGHLIGIDLDMVNLRYTTAGALGRQLADAIRAAEREAEAARTELMAAARRRPGQHQVLTAYRRR